MKVRMGDRVRIISDTVGHGFAIGSIVTITDIGMEGLFYCARRGGMVWRIHWRECAPIDLLEIKDVCEKCNAKMVPTSDEDIVFECPTCGDIYTKYGEVISNELAA